MKLVNIIILLSIVQIPKINTYLLFSSDNYYSPQNIYSFAEYLFNNNDYIRAAGEFQRYLIFNNNQFNDSIIYKIGLCYQLSNEYGKAMCYYNKIINEYSQSKLFEVSHYQIAYSYFQSKEYGESVNYIHNNKKKMSTLNGLLRINRLLGINFLYQREWKPAYNHFSALINNEPPGCIDSSLTMLNYISLKGTQLCYKNSNLAGLFSSLIPGSGKIYSGNVNDGLYSFLVISLVTWQAYDGFNKNGTNSFKGWVYGALGTTLYFGNIYGSIISVKLYNNKIENELLNKIDIQLEWKI